MLIPTAQKQEMLIGTTPEKNTDGGIEKIEEEMRSAQKVPKEQNERHDRY